MKTLSTVFIALVISIAFVACQRGGPRSLTEVSAQLADQFRAQHAADKASAPRKLITARLTSFDAPAGNPRPYVELAVTWEDGVTFTSVPMSQLGDGVFGVTYRDPKTGEVLSAVLNFR